jgi:hypothetical protein
MSNSAFYIKNNNNLTFVAQKIADELSFSYNPWKNLSMKMKQAAGSRLLIFLTQHVYGKCQTVHFTWKIQYDVYCTRLCTLKNLKKKPKILVQNTLFYSAIS